MQCNPLSRRDRRRTFFLTTSLAAAACFVTARSEAQHSAAPQINYSSEVRNAERSLPQTISTKDAKLRASLTAGAGISVGVADFDADGTKDLVTGYATANGGALVLQRGFVEALAPTATEQNATTNAVGLTYAFAAINKVLNTQTGALPGPALPSGATLPTPEIDTLADILVACVNSAGGAVNSGTSDGSACGNLFKLAPNAAGTIYPTDTITAAMNIAQNPARNVAALTMQEGTTPLYLSALGVNSPPNAFTIALTYTGGGLSSPQGVAIDTSGNVWVADSGNSSVSEFNNTGAAVSGTSGFTAGNINIPYALAIDQNGNVWVANSNNSITKLAVNGSSGTAYTGNGLLTPRSIAIDGSGSVWVANSGSSSVSAFSNGGGVLNGSPYSGGGLDSPAAIALSPK